MMRFDGRSRAERRGPLRRLQSADTFAGAACLLTHFVHLCAAHLGTAEPEHYPQR